MIQITYLRKKGPRADSISLHPRGAQQAAERGELLAHVSVELLRAHRHRLGTEVRVPLAPVRRLQGVGEVALPPIADSARGRRAAGPPAPDHQPRAPNALS